MSRRLGLFRRAPDEPVIPALTRHGCGLLRPHEPHLFETSVQRFSCPGVGATTPSVTPSVPEPPSVSDEPTPADATAEPSV